MKTYKFIFKVIKQCGIFGDVGTKEMIDMIFDHQRDLLDNKEFRDKNKLILEKVDKILNGEGEFGLRQHAPITNEKLSKLIEEITKSFPELTADESSNVVFSANRLSPEEKDSPYPLRSEDLPILESQSKQSL